jgi:hypothetical protein
MPLDPETLPPVVRDFAFTQGLDPLWAYDELLLGGPSEGALFFWFEWGPGLDCPAGCFFASGFGLAKEESVGWVSYQPIAHLGAPAADAVFDIAASDQDLVDPDLLFRLRAVNDYLYHDYRLLLACDEDVPEATLVHILDTIPLDGYPFLAVALLEHPTVLMNPEIVRRIAALPGTWYSGVRARALEILEALEQGLEPPPYSPPRRPQCAIFDALGL